MGATHTNSLARLANVDDDDTIVLNLPPNYYTFLHTYEVRARAIDLVTVLQLFYNLRFLLQVYHVVGLVSRNGSASPVLDFNNPAPCSTALSPSVVRRASKVRASFENPHMRTLEWELVEDNRQDTAIQRNASSFCSKVG